MQQISGERLQDHWSSGLLNDGPSMTLTILQQGQACICELGPEIWQKQTVNAGMRLIMSRSFLDLYQMS